MRQYTMFHNGIIGQRKQIGLLNIEAIDTDTNKILD